MSIIYSPAQSHFTFLDTTSLTLSLSLCLSVSLSLELKCKCERAITVISVCKPESQPATPFDNDHDCVEGGWVRWCLLSGVSAAVLR